MRSPRGASAAILNAARRDQATLLMSIPLAMEYESVCRRPEHQQAAGLPEGEADVFLNAGIAMAEPGTTHFLWRTQLHDPNDEMVLEVAINGPADLLVTFNVRDFGAVPSRFGVEVMLPREAILRIRK